MVWGNDYESSWDCDDFTWSRIHATIKTLCTLNALQILCDHEYMVWGNDYESSLDCDDFTWSRIHATIKAICKGSVDSLYLGFRAVVYYADLKALYTLNALYMFFLVMSLDQN